MGSVIERLRERAQLRIEEEGEHFHSDLLGCDVYVFPLTVADSIAAPTISDDQPTAEKLEGLVKYIILRARNKDGSPIFRNKDRNDLVASLTTEEAADLVTQMSGLDGDDDPKS